MTDKCQKNLYLACFQYHYKINTRSKFNEWEKTYINRICKYFVLSEKIQIGPPDKVSVYWEKNYSDNDEKLTFRAFLKVLDQGVNFDYKWSTRPPNKYLKVMLKYGLIPPFEILNKNPSFLAEFCKFYNPAVWPNFSLLKTKINVQPINPLDVQGNFIIHISDVHGRHKELNLPMGKILVCSGDLCLPDDRNLEGFLSWFSDQPHQYKILVAGNHDESLMHESPVRETYLDFCKQNGIIYLEDSGVVIEGVRFWGSPWTPIREDNTNNAFVLSRPRLMKKWDLVPNDVQVLVTHGPPMSIGDNCTKYFTSKPYCPGDYGLLKTIARLPDLKYHLFGHSHRGYGIYRTSDEKIVFSNAALFTTNMKQITSLKFPQ